MTPVEKVTLGFTAGFTGWWMLRLTLVLLRRCAVAVVGRSVSDFRGRTWWRHMADADRCRRCWFGRAEQLDHLIPASKGGPARPWNALPLCAHCNSRKGNRMTLRDVAWLALPGVNDWQPVAAGAVGVIVMAGR